MSPFPNRLAPQWHHRAVRRHQTHRSGTNTATRSPEPTPASMAPCQPVGKMSDSMAKPGTRRDPVPWCARRDAGVVAGLRDCSGRLSAEPAALQTSIP